MTKGVSVLHAIPSLALHHGGPSQSVAGLLNAMVRTGSVRVSLICAAAQAEPPLDSPMHRYSVQFANQRFGLPTRGSCQDMRQAVDRSDIVHVHSFWNGFASTIIAHALRAGKPVVLSPRGCLHPDAIAQSSLYLKKVFGAVLGHRQLAHLSGCHFQTEDEADSSIGVQGLPSVILDNGVTVPEFATPVAQVRRRLFGSTAEQTNLVFLGRLARIKGIDLQIAALKLLRARGVPAYLNLVGPDGGDLDRLIEVSQAMGVTEYVRVHGPVYSTAKHDWLRAADAVLMTSDFENNSNAALEAMAAGGRLIATQGTLQVTPVNAGAAICVPRTPEALAQAILEAPVAPVRAAARHYVQASHDWNERANRMVAFYERFR